jgi:O-antigen/teichoic acid export membrane protein
LILVPAYGYEGAAWAHLICYGAMVLMSYLLGRRFYPVPYDLPRVIGYIALGLALYAGHLALVEQLGWNGWVSASMLMTGYLALVLMVDGRRLRRAAQ